VVFKGHFDVQTFGIFALLHTTFGQVMTPRNMFSMENIIFYGARQAVYYSGPFIFLKFEANIQSK